MSPAVTNGELGHVRCLPLSYDGQDSIASATKLVLALRPQWAPSQHGGEDYLDFVRFTDGITNTLLKAVFRQPGLSKEDIDSEAVLLRAYGNGTHVLIDREREAANHELLMKHNLAPELLARFENGMLYRFVSGSVASPQDLSDPPLLSATARRLAQWHATVPCLHDDSALENGSQTNGHVNKSAPNGANGESNGAVKLANDNAVPGLPSPNVWTTMQKWIRALPTDTEAQRERQTLLQREIGEMVQQLSQRPGLGPNGLVFAHCDLLCGNIIIHHDGCEVPSVSFIDYEYATPSPAAFDLANHFAEWGGFDCDYSAMPTRSQRHTFIQEYIKTYFKLSGGSADLEKETGKLMAEVDVFRGVPGFYWGIWALIQAQISNIDFDYASYAETRLGEYWAVKAEEDGSRAAAGKEMSLREKTWSRSE